MNTTPYPARIGLKFSVFATLLVFLLLPSIAGAQITGPVFAPCVYAGDDLVALSEQSGTKVFMLAFVNDDGSGHAAWGGYSPVSSDTAVLSTITALRNSGGDVIITFGGWDPNTDGPGSEPALDAKSLAGLIAEYQSVIDKYHATMLDFDVEGPALPLIATNHFRNQALAALQATNPGLAISFTLPVFTNGLDPNAVDLLSNAKLAGLNVSIVNIMTMDYLYNASVSQWSEPVANPSSMGQNAIDASNATIAQLNAIGLSAQLGICPEIGQNDPLSQPEVFTLADAKLLVAYALTNDRVGRLDFWSVERDQACPGNAQTAGSSYCSGVDQNDDDFSHLFLAFDPPSLIVGYTAQAPAVLAQPVSQTIAAGSTVTFAVSAAGQPAPSYQWSLNGNVLSGATQPTLVITGTSGANAGTYACLLTNSSGSVTSSPATLTVVSTSNPGHLVNISARAFVGSGADVLIAGYVVEGAGALPLLLRSSGPALSSQLSGILPDPQLQLYSGSTVVDSNQGWAGNVQIASIASAVGATTWANPLSKDSALLETENPGAYTGITSGVTGDTGIALAEVYDATPPGTLSSSELANISARAFVGTGGNVLIAGFVVGGTTSKTVLIRASGPAISSQVAGTLSDPQLQLYSGSTVIGSNSGWGASAQIATAASSVGASAWSGPSADSALLVTLAPGAYTAIVSGVTGDTGVALVEVYAVP